MTPSELKIIHETLRDGRTVNPVTVREFLSWFDVRRRGVAIVERIREELNSLSMITLPDFEEPWIDGLIAFHLISSDVIENEEESSPGSSDFHSISALVEDGLEVEPNWEHREAGYRLSRLAAANKNVVSISPNASLFEAVTQMMMNDFSQLPVMVGERDIKGVITLTEVATRSVLGKGGDRVSDFMVDPIIIDDNASIFDAIKLVVERDFVFVRDRQRRISGVVTAADLSLQFRALSEPFLLLSEIETHVRNLIGKVFSVPELSAARAPGGTHEIQSVSDLTFGEYVSILQDQRNWERIDVKIDRVLFCKQLDRVRVIRNQVMHFDPDGLDDEDIKILQEFSLFLKKFEVINS